MKKPTNNQFVTSIEHLIKLIKEKHNDYAIVLAGELGIYSRKTIKYNPKYNRFTIKNHIDDSIQTLTKNQIMNSDYSNIGKAIPKNCLICIIK